MPARGGTHPAGRFKIGFTKAIESLKKRIQDAKTWVPEAETEGALPGQELRERLTRFVTARSDSLEEAPTGFPVGDWSRRAEDGTVDGAGRDVLWERANQCFRHVLTIDNEGE